MSLHMGMMFDSWAQDPSKISQDPYVARLQINYAVRDRDGKLLYGPQPKQAVAHAAEERNLLYGGAMAGGKSHWARWHNIISALYIPNFRGLLLRRTYKELQTSQLLAIYLEVPDWLAKWSSGDAQLKFDNGSLIQFGHCNTDKDFAQWLSSEWDMITLDEATTFTPRQLTLLRSRLRTNKPNVRPQFCLSSNPGGEGHIWCKARFLDRQVPHEEEPGYDSELYGFIGAKVEDNQYVNEEYVEFLDTLPEDERRAYRDGDWDVFAGQYFRQLRRDIHGFNFPEDMPDEWVNWPRYRSYDWGFAKPASMGWWVVDPDGNPWRYRELYATGMEVEDFMALALDMEQMDPNQDIEYTVCDPACYDSSHGPSKAERAANSGVPMIPAERKALGDRGVRIEGWSLMRRYVDPNCAPILRVAFQCRDWWRTVPTLVHDDKRVEDLNSDGEDHAADETRYFLTSRPQPMFIEATYSPESFEFRASEASDPRYKKVVGPKIQRRPGGSTQVEHPEFGELY